MESALSIRHVIFNINNETTMFDTGCVSRVFYFFTFIIKSCFYTKTYQLKINLKQCMKN